MSRFRIVIVAGTAGLLLMSFIIAPMLMTVPSFLGGLGGTTDLCTEYKPGEAALSTVAQRDIPADYLELYKRHGAKIGVQWNVLAAVGKRETDHGRSRLPGVSDGTNHAGAAGPMQFLISTWGGKPRIKEGSKFNGYASDGDGDGWMDVYNPADAILGAARMLKRNGAPENLERALFVYNRAMWYVRQVLEIARRYAGDGTVPVPRDAAPECDLDSVEAAPNNVVRGILRYALAQQGKPYIWGGTGPEGFDCSGIIYMAYRDVGLSIPRTTFVQWPFGVRIPEGSEQPGDLVFFNAGPGTGPNNPGHVGMVVAKGKMIEARCRLCGPIKITTYSNRTSLMGFTRPLDHPSVKEQLRRLEQA
ncbi:NlpC/P60 family protein [Rhizohabitans arisaemae]|uniref:C40 family peptidase n=1 Tax=Rhizohabitans arisaemae TaxID=2720610 RepID=UPI0024B0C1A0|nr:bifunctional lytic transglycosylase/C40 family peptidase [Rhizohabitans arisaemae]